MDQVVNGIYSIESRKDTSVVRILIAEDDEGIREFIGAFLMDEGFEIVLAVNGAEALNLIAQEAPDLIFMDMFMPTMDGRTFMSVYRNMEGPHVPVIGMSANANDSSLLKVFDGFIAKPFDLDQVLDCIHVYTQG